ncbi:MAG: hypothetical protein OJF55_002198 [Rhodanobacteraceae bacterium]|nr:MAG: hypothetical protein OJF55_002198 [Rhodanobacteraceae bacterium]
MSRAFYRNIAHRILGLVLLLLGATGGAWAQCPKVLMFDGVDILTQTNGEQARYWGQTVGVQGFFLNNVMPGWQQDVGTDPSSSAWQRARQFQNLYAGYGVTDNFIKVAAYKFHDWSDASQNAALVRNFAHAAALARFAGFKGVVLDLEPYSPVWGDPDSAPALVVTVQQVGREIAEAMRNAYPGMTLVVLPDVVRLAHQQLTPAQAAKERMRALTDYKSARGPEKYILSEPFLVGLLSVPWSHVVIATEQTYSQNGPVIPRTMEQAAARYRDFDQHNQLATGDISIAPGLWPLGHSSSDKSARESPENFLGRLQAAMSVASRYVWIYGYGSAWQTDGPYYKKGPVVDNFPDYVRAVHEAEQQCERNGS